jgi:NADPH2:quinone reductase
MAWGVGGWLVTTFMREIGPASLRQLKERIVRDLRTIFASRYSKEISLAEVLHLDVMAAYRKRETGQKYLVNPNKGTS